METEALLCNGEIIRFNDSIIPNGNFKWYEATKNLLMLPENIDQVKRVIFAAHNMEHIRKLLGNQPVYVNSWIRTKRHNQNVGGASNSRHLFGDALDIWLPNMSPVYIYQKLDSKHSNGGLGLYKTHVHIDFRGHKARW